jgi:Leucine-rich repeat (LRR) protein
MNYFWHYSPETTPKPVVHPRDLRPAERLCVSSSQQGLPSHKQKALVQEWCELLPTLADVRLLWISSKAPQALFDAACRMPKLEGLWIKWSSIKSMASIAGLPNLKYLHLGSSTQLESIAPLSDRRGLEWLGLENLATIRHLDPIATLSDLQGLSLEGSMWSSWEVETLAPAGALTSLRYLSLANLRAADRTLTPLYPLQNLETLITAEWWDAGELDELRRRNPRLQKS